MWLEKIQPSDKISRMLVDRLPQMELKDRGYPITFSPIDTASTVVLTSLLRKQLCNLQFQLPRGEHDFSIFCGLITQMVRICSNQLEPSNTLNFSGPVVIIGMNTQILKRLGHIEISSLNLADGLMSHRLRSDGRIVNTRNQIEVINQHKTNLFLYLNTRVGWPRLPKGIDAGVVIIDRTSFKASQILLCALEWAEANNSTKVVVISDIGDEETTHILKSSQREYIICPWAPHLISRIPLSPNIEDGPSLLATNRLFTCRQSPVAKAVCNAALIDRLFRKCYTGIFQAKEISKDFPMPVKIARRLLNNLSSCLGTIAEYNQWAAMDHRSTSMSSLHTWLKGATNWEHTGEWHCFQETEWADLRHNVFSLYEMMEEENPKLFTLALLLEELKYESDVCVVIRVTNQAAGNALATDLSSFNFDITEGEGNLFWLPMGFRLPWTTHRRIEIYPGSPAPWHRSALWSGESTERIFLVYPYEQHSLSNIYSQQKKNIYEASSGVFSLYKAGLPPIFKWPDMIETVYNYQFIPSTEEISTETDHPLEFSLDVFFNEQEDLIEKHPYQSHSAVLCKALPILLEPGKETWWVGEKMKIDVLRRSIHQSLEPSQLHTGDEIIIPRGEGRENLFQRIIQVVHSRTDYKTYETVLMRLRRAVWKIYQECDESWENVEDSMRQKGSSVSGQSIRLWALGTTIAPNKEEDIARIGLLSNDKILTLEYRKIAKMASKIRSNHRKVGRLLSGAMREATIGQGPSLTRLVRIMGNIDLDELLDEFQVRTVREIGESEEIPLHKIGSLTRR
ncbi:MAG: DrmE family protein [Candidatus Sabulitectum sp.]|nr:DrmE family protein [Candidatus Sabulitectum sp.]